MEPNGHSLAEHKRQLGDAFDFYMGRVVPCVGG
jgi:hypothetical protein